MSSDPAGGEPAGAGPALPALPDEARLFVAVWPPAEVVAVLSALVREVRSGVRWTMPGQWHVTLHFLGKAEVEAAVQALRRLGGEPACVALLGSEVVRLGREVLAVPVDGLAALAGAVDRAFEGIGRPAEPRPFTAHVTLARGKGVRPSWIQSGLSRTLWPVEAVSLVRSDLHPRGARYETVASVDLAPA